METKLNVEKLQCIRKAKWK